MGKGGRRFWESGVDIRHTRRNQIKRIMKGGESGRSLDGWTDGLQWYAMAWEIFWAFPLASSFFCYAKGELS